MAETIETTICVVARLFEMKESKGPVELLPITVVTSREMLASSGRMLAQIMSSLSIGADCQAK